MNSGSPSFGNELRYRDPANNRLDGPFIPVDFVKNAESLGAKAYDTNSLEEFRDALEASKGDDRTVLIYVRVDTEVSVPSFDGWWDVPIAEVSGEQSVNDAKRAYDEARQQQQYFAPGLIEAGKD
jgi:3D-(3,5/4)-trihydroxycyclohexane-1,2-dione acylhydrolase (decyclizing)